MGIILILVLVAGPISVTVQIVRSFCCWTPPPEDDDDSFYLPPPVSEEGAPKIAGPTPETLKMSKLNGEDDDDGTVSSPHSSLTTTTPSTTRSSSVLSSVVSINALSEELNSLQEDSKEIDEDDEPPMTPFLPPASSSSWPSSRPTPSLPIISETTIKSESAGPASNEKVVEDKDIKNGSEGVSLNNAAVPFRRSSPRKGPGPSSSLLSETSQTTLSRPPLPRAQTRSISTDLVPMSYQSPYSQPTARAGMTNRKVRSYSPNKGKAAVLDSRSGRSVSTDDVSRSYKSYYSSPLARAEAPETKNKKVRSRGQSNDNVALLNYRPSKPASADVLSRSRHVNVANI